jgi:hypothetical protein
MNCKYCNSEQKFNGLKTHEIYCKLNPNRKNKGGENNPMYGKIGSNQHKKAKSEGKKIQISEVTRMKISEKLKGRRFSDEQRKKISEYMKKAVLDNPDSYSASNVSGRAKIIDYRGFKLKGKWELETAKWFDEKGIKWTNIIPTPFEYFWDGSIHYYFPDFYLEEFDLYVEVKGYEREKDREKWKSVERIIILKKEEIQRIKEGTYFLPSL